MKFSLPIKNITLTAILAGAFFVLGSASGVHAATVVGNEAYEVSWHGAPASDNGDNYQVYFGQANGNKEEYSVFDGLTAQSRSVWLRHLKPCTEYSWSVKALQGGRGWWIIRDRRFTTGGTCETPTAFSPVGATMVNEVMTQTAASGEVGTSTISWSPVRNATAYYVYYGTDKGGPYVNSVKVPSTGTSLTIYELKAGMDYYYRIAAEVDGKQVWYGEKMLQTESGEKPVLGAKNAYNPDNAEYYGQNDSVQVLAEQSVGTQMRMRNPAPNWRMCAESNGSASVSIRVPPGVSVARVHILYGSSGRYEHALRNLEPSAREVTIGHLNPCKPFYYRLGIVDLNGRVHWQAESTVPVTP